MKYSLYKIPNINKQNLFPGTLPQYVHMYYVYSTCLLAIMQHSASLSHRRGLLLKTCTASTKQSNAGMAFPQCNSWIPMLYNNSKCRLMPMEFSVLPERFLSVMNQKLKY